MKHYKLFVQAKNGFGETVWSETQGGPITKDNAAFMAIGFYPEDDMEVGESIRREIKTTWSKTPQWFRIQRVA